MLPTTPGETLAALVDIAGEPIHARRQFVLDVLHKVIDEQTDPESALLVLDLAGLAANRDVIDDALTAHGRRTGLADGTLDPYVEDPSLKVGREQAIDDLVEEARSVFDAAVCRLAITRAEHRARVHDVRRELAAVADGAL